MKYIHKYDDIINIPYEKSRKHPHMSLYARSAQFAPFAALTGYEDAVQETGRLTNERIELSEELKVNIDSKLQYLRENIAQKQEVSFTFFVPDSRKSGGAYITKQGIIKKFDELEQIIILADQSQIPINEIISVNFDQNLDGLDWG